MAIFGTLFCPIDSNFRLIYVLCQHRYAFNYSLSSVFKPKLENLMDRFWEKH